MRRTELFRLPDRLGFGLVQSRPKKKKEGDGNQGRSGKDHAYAALHQVAVAADALVARHNDTPLHVLAVPMIVLRGQLFEARLDGGEVTLIDLEEATIEWRSPGLTMLRYIRLFTEAGLKEKAADVYASAVAFVEAGHNFLLKQNVGHE